MDQNKFFHIYNQTKTKKKMPKPSSNNNYKNIMACKTISSLILLQM